MEDLKKRVQTSYDNLDVKSRRRMFAMIFIIVTAISFSIKCLKHEIQNPYPDMVAFAYIAYTIYLSTCDTVTAWETKQSNMDANKNETAGDVYKKTLKHIYFNDYLAPIVFCFLFGIANQCSGLSKFDGYSFAIYIITALVGYVVKEFFFGMLLY